MSQSNRYLEFADIALGAKKPTSHRKKPRSALGRAQKQHGQHHHDAENKVIPINSRATSNLRGHNEGFGAFRNSR